MKTLLLFIACLLLASCAQFPVSGTFRGKGATITVDNDGKTTKTNVDFNWEDFLNARQ